MLYSGVSRIGGGGESTLTEKDVYYWMQVLPMMLEIILTGVALIYFTAR